MREIEQSILGRAPEHDLEPSLDRIAAVMHLLGDPQHAFPVIHVTGTNGKTSTTRMIERMLREMGLSTGRFTSPHLHNIRERIALNGEAIDAVGSPLPTRTCCPSSRWSMPSPHQRVPRG